jgi:arylsulfatase A-like enzyme
MRRLLLHCLCFAILFCTPISWGAGKAEHIVVVVWDGMRPDFANEQYSPTLHTLADEGVFFEDHHSVYCTATVVNGTAMATGAYPEHSGVIGNQDYRPDIDPRRPSTASSPGVVRKGDELTGGHYIPYPTVAELVREAGMKTAISGSKNVALVQDRKQRDTDCCGVNVFDGESMPPSVFDSIKSALGPFPGNVSTKSDKPNAKRDEWSTQALIQHLWSNGVPEFSLLWLSEPDYSQHAKGPGSPKALAAIKSSDDQLAAVLRELDRRKLRDKTDVFVVSDHGFSTVERSVDMAAELQKAGFRAGRQFSSKPKPGEILVVGQGGSAFFYIHGHDAETSNKLVKFLQQQDFTGVIFTRSKAEGTFDLEQGLVNTPNPPDVVVSLRWSNDKSPIGVPGMYFCDGTRAPGEGSHASLSKYDVHNTLVAAGPDFKSGFKDELPSGNIDLAPTILWLLGVKPTRPMDGRVLGEALTVDAPPVGEPVRRTVESSRDLEESVWRQYLQTSQVNDTIYLDEGNGDAIKK